MCAVTRRAFVLCRSISPALPAGLSLGAGDGVISGTPTELMAETVFTVTAENCGNVFCAATDTTTVTITVVQGPVPPAVTGYTTLSMTLFNRLPISPDNVPVTSGGPITSW